MTFWYLPEAGCQVGEVEGPRCRRGSRSNHRTNVAKTVEEPGLYWGTTGRTSDAHRGDETQVRHIRETRTRDVKQNMRDRETPATLNNP